MNSRTNIDSFEEDGDYLINPSDVLIGKAVGEGQFGSVYIGKYFGDLVAVKKQICEAKGLQGYLLREINVLKRVQHDHIMSYFGAYDVLHEGGLERSLFIVSEFCQGGDLLDLLLDQDEELGWNFRTNIAAQAASAIDYMHQNSIIHRDIKSSNILLNQNWQCKICDFGLAREVDANSSDRMTLCGTNEYMAPELLFDEGNYSFEIDIFSFGMVLLEILGRGKVGHAGFAERSPRSKFQMDIEAVRLMITGDAPESLISLAFQCVDDEACNRPAGGDVVDWLQDLLGDLPSDTIALPKLKHPQSLLTSMDQMFEAESTRPKAEALSPPGALTPSEKCPHSNGRPKVRNMTPAQPFLDYTTRQIILATKYTVTPKAVVPKKAIRSPHSAGVDNPILVTPVSKARRKASSGDEMPSLNKLMTRMSMISQRDRTPPRPGTSSSQSASGGNSSGEKGTPTGVLRGRISFGTSCTKDKKERDFATLMKEKFKDIEKDKDVHMVKDKAKEKDSTVKEKERENDKVVIAKEKTKEKDKIVVAKEIEKDSEKEKEKEKDRVIAKQKSKEKDIFGKEKIKEKDSKITFKVKGKESERVKEKEKDEELVVDKDKTKGKKKEKTEVKVVIGDKRFFKCNSSSGDDNTAPDGKEKEIDRVVGVVVKIQEPEQEQESGENDDLDVAIILSEMSYGFEKPESASAMATAGAPRGINEEKGDWSGTDDSLDSRSSPFRMAHVPSPRRRQSDISASLRSSPTRHYSEGSQQMRSRTAAGSKDSSPDTCEWRAKQGHPTESAIKAAFRQSDSYDYPCDYSEKVSRGRTDSVGTTQSRSDSMLVGEEQDILYVDKEVFREGFIYKKNSTGFFRNWKRVHFRITRKYMLWTSSAGLHSKYYCLRGASIIKTLQFRFQVMNLTGSDGTGKYIHREFAAESYADMDDWVRALQEAIDRANESEGAPHIKDQSNSTGSSYLSGSADSMGSLYQSLSMLENTENPRYTDQCCTRSVSNSIVKENRTDSGTDDGLDEFKAITIHRNTSSGDDVMRRDRRQSRSIRKLFSETAHTQSLSPMPHHRSKRNFSIVQTSLVGAWLEGLGLRQYEAAFIGKGFDSAETIQRRGLGEEILDSLGIHIALHRTVLKSFGCRNFSSQIEVDVTKSRDVGGVVISYMVVTTWRTLRSSVSLLFSDIKDFHTSLEVDLKDDPLTLTNVPKFPDPKLFTLPCKLQDADGCASSSTSVMAITSPLRHQVLQSYLRQLVILLENTPHLSKLLLFLELVPPPLEVKSKS